MNKKNAGVSFHRFPKDEELLKEWLVKISRVDLIVTNESRVCSEHIEPHCYERDLKAELFGKEPTFNLKPDAVPTILAHRPAKKPRLSSEKRIEERARKEVNALVSLCVNTALKQV